MIRRPPRSTRMTHSFPTRRSSDLIFALCTKRYIHSSTRNRCRTCSVHNNFDFLKFLPLQFTSINQSCPRNNCGSVRSEEHTSELQSLMRISYAVFCLKKKNKNNNRITENYTRNNVKS